MTSKKEYFETLIDIVNSAETENADELVTFLNAQIEMLDNRAEKARIRRANAPKKEKEPDELYDVVVSLLTTTAQTAEQIANKIDGPDITRNKISARLVRAVKEGVAEKVAVSRLDNKPLTGYIKA